MKTTIMVSEEVAEALRKLGSMGDTYESVLRKLLKLPPPPVRKYGHKAERTKR